MAIIKPDKPVDTLLFDGLHLTNPKCLQITMLLHPTCHWMMYWSFKNPFTSNLKPSPAGLNDVNVWLMDFGSGYVCRWPGPGSALTHRDTVVKASLAVKFQWSRILTKRFFSMKNSDFFPPPPPPLTPCLSPCDWGQLLWSDLDERENGSTLKGIWGRQTGKGGEDGAAALHPCHLNTLSSVLIAKSARSLFLLSEMSANDGAAAPFFKYARPFSVLSLFILSRRSKLIVGFKVDG